MGETIYLHRQPNSGLGLLFTRGTTVIHTGLEVQTEDDPLLEEISRLCGMDFFRGEQPPELPLYGVPYLWVFASDGRGGWFAGTEENKDGPVYYIDQNRCPHLVVASYRLLFDLIVFDPDWRRKHLPGGPWPRLPEDREGRRKLGEALRLPAPPPEELHLPDALPRVFASREEAERAFPIQDVWTLLRQEKEPRFQIHPMMSPADREGRALVHYTAWREAYTGLMDERVLAEHTLERCREAGKDRHFGQTYVALDRENGDRVVGFATILYTAREFVSVPEAGELVALYVLREFQGLGLGRQLLERCLAWLHRPRVALFVLKGNEKAVGFYRRMGFRFTGHEITQRLSGCELTEQEMVLEHREEAG